jgi:FkbM family methyltransferase
VQSTRLQARARAAAARAADRFADRVADRLQARAAPAPAPPEAHVPDREEIDNAHLVLLLGFLLREDSNCLDVGANQGRFLSHMVQRAPRGSHTAWEPIPALAGELSAAFPQVEVRRAALSDETGEADFTLVPEDYGYSGLRERAYPREFRTEKIRVPIERLDDVLDPDYAPTLIKVDVEGAELQVFRGGLETLARNRPAVVFEHGPGAADRYGTAPEAVHDLLAGEIGLRIFDLDATGPLTRDQFAELFASGTRWNYVALP